MNYLLDKIKICLSAREPIYNFSSAALVQIEQESELRLAEEYYSSRMMGFRQNYLFKDGDEGTIFIGFCRNTYKEQSEGLKKVCVEFNPQKVKVPLVLKRWFGDLSCKYSSVLSCDVAMDFHLSLDQVRVQTKKKLMFVGHSNNLTRYIAPQEANNRIKIYDKRQERVESNKQDFVGSSPLTRVEISLKNPTFHESGFLTTADICYLNEIVKSVGEVYIPRKMPLLRTALEEKYGKYDPALCYLLEHADNTTQLQALSLLSVNTRAKYKAWLSSGDYAPIDVDLYRFASDVGKQLLECIYSVTPHVNLLR